MSETAENIDYNLPKFSKPKWFFYVFGLFFAAFLMYFPFVSKIESLVRDSLKSVPGCSISYDSMSFSFLLPKLVVKDLQLPASCFNQRGAPMTFKESFLHIRGLSFSPFGPHFKLSTQLFGSPLEALISVGIGGAKVSMNETTVDLAKISPLLPAGLKLAGKARIDLLAKAGQSGIQDVDLRLSSKNLTLPSQNINALSLKRLAINNLLLTADMSSNGTINVREFVMGDAEAPIRANFKGDVKLNRQMPRMSRLNLSGEVAFSQAFMDDYSIIGLVMNQFDKKDDFYQIQLKGTLSSPVPSSPSK